MSTFKIEGAKWLEGLFPEWNWQELAREKYEEIFQKIRVFQDLDEEVIKYLQDNKIRIGYHKQYKAGGGWTVLRNITLSPGDDPLSPYVLSLIIHETFHLKQSIWMRLSMQGELRAWQYQRQTYNKITSKDIGDSGQAYAGTKVHWDEIAKLASDSRDDLIKAQELTRKVAADYRSNCLPLYPLPQEIAFYWKQGKYAEAFKAVWNLITCR
jgi:hypothetical protein